MKIHIKQIRTYILVALLSILILIWVLKLWKANLAVPFSYAGDSLYTLMWIKSIIDTGWYTENNFIGAPFGLKLYDFPLVDSFNFLALKILSFFTNAFVAHNLFYILTFPLTAVSSFFACKQLKISTSISIVVALLYTFLPYHFVRVGHLFLSSYWTVPLATIVILKLFAGSLPVFPTLGLSVRNFKITALNGTFFIYAVFCIILGSTGIYYAFFSCLLIGTASIAAFIDRQDKRVFLKAITLVAMIAITVFFNIFPSIVYILLNGENKDVAHRFASESEIYGLKIIHLLMPIQEHRFPVLKALAERYVNGPSLPLQNENSSASLGLLGSLGFLILLFNVIFNFRKTVVEDSSFSHFYKTIDHLSVLNITATLFATIGGFGSLFALLISPQMRGLNRISVFIGFFSLLAIAIVLELVKRNYVKHRSHHLLFNSLLTLILIIGILDQTAPAFVPNYAQLKTNFLNDQRFVHDIEKSLPANAMVFQLPYVSFPETLPIYRMADYDHFRGYLHSKELIWSYGAMKGRHDWQELLAQEPMSSLLPKLLTVGFSGIYLNRNGYVDSAKAIEAELEKELKLKPIVSDNGRFSFFTLSQYKNNWISQHSANQINDFKNRILSPIKIEWDGGFYPLEISSVEAWRWMKQRASLTISNPTSLTRKLSISAALTTGWSEHSEFHIKSVSSSKKFKINSTPTSIIYKLEIPPESEMVVSFISNAKQVNAPLDSRQLFVRAINFKVVEECDLCDVTEPKHL